MTRPRCYALPCRLRGRESPAPASQPTAMRPAVEADHLRVAGSGLAPGGLEREFPDNLHWQMHPGFAAPCPIPTDRTVLKCSTNGLHAHRDAFSGIPALPACAEVFFNPEMLQTVPVTDLTVLAA